MLLYSSIELVNGPVGPVGPVRPVNLVSPVRAGPSRPRWSRGSRWARGVGTCVKDNSRLEGSEWRFYRFRVGATKV